MPEETTEILDDTIASMEKAVEHFETELIKIRAGKANPTMLDGINVDYYGSPVPINQVGNLSADRCADTYHTTMGKEYASAD